MSWSVVREIGIEYPRSASASSAERLEFPIFAAQATDGSYLIVDEPWAEKPIPFRLECRTIRVTEAGEVVYDSTAHGIDDGYGCLANDGSLALLRRTKWELLLLSSHEEVTSRFDLTNFSKRLPTAMSCSSEGTFLILFVDRSHQLDIVEIDRHGRLSGNSANRGIRHAVTAAWPAPAVPAKRLMEIA
jgi:hypothetical protein